MARGIRQEYNDINKPISSFGPCKNLGIGNGPCDPKRGDDEYGTHFRYYFSAVVERVNWNIIQLFSSAEEKDGELQSNFRRFVDCHGKCYKLSPVTIDIINEDEMNDKLREMVGTKYKLSRGSVKFNYKFGRDGYDQVWYENFPVADKSISVVNPMRAMDQNIRNLDSVISRLENGLKDNNEDFFTLTNTTSYVVIPMLQGIEAVKMIAEEGRKL